MTLRQISALLALLVLPACGGGGGSGPTGPPPEPPVLNTPDDVVESLRISWETHDADLLASLLSQGFEFFPSANDVDFWGLPTSWDRAFEINCSRNLFAGNSGMRPGNTYQPPVDNRFPFGINLLPVEQDWAVTVRVDQPFAGLLARHYDVVMTAQYVNGDLDFVGSRNEFFVQLEDVTQADGSPAKQYFIRAWRDQGNPDPALRHTQLAWGYFKSFFQ